MTKYTGSALRVTVGGTPLSNLISCEVNEGAATYDTTIVGENAETHLPGKTNGQGTINLLDDSAEAAYAACVPGQSASLVVFPQGNTGGYPKLSFTATFTGRQRPVAHNAATPLTITFAINGAITPGVAP